MPGTLAMGDACQSGKMATLSISILFVFNISFLPNHRVEYYDYNYCKGVLLRGMQLVCIAGYCLHFSFNVTA